MSVTQKNNNDQTSTLTLDIQKKDYLDQVEKSLSKQAKNAQVKGFRKGKVPAGLVKKMYGNAILADEVNKLINQQINKHLQENEVEILGQPIPVEDEAIQFDINDPQDFSFSYKIGHKPEVDISYIETKPEFTQYQIDISEEMIDKEVEHIRGQYGDVEHPAEKPENMDAVEVTLKELDDEGNVKEGGYEHTTSFGFDQLKLKKDQTAIGKLGVGDSYSPFNVYRAFDKDKEAIAKQILELTPEMMLEVGEAFELKLDQINRVAEAEINQDFFDKVYGKDKVTSEEEMREKIKENLGNYLGQAAENQLKNDIYKALLDNIKVNLPDEFLKNWLIESRNNDSESEVSKEDIEEEYPDFSKSLASSLLFNAVAKKGEIGVEYDELKDKAKENLIQQFRYYGMPLEDNEEMLDGMVQRFMSDEKQVRQTHDQLMDDKIFNYLKENVKLKNKVVSLDEFNALNKEQDEE